MTFTPAELTDCRYALLSDDVMAAHALVVLGRAPYFLQPPAFHLRLLAALCNDCAGCDGARTDIGNRLVGAPGSVSCVRCGPGAGGLVVCVG